MFVKEMLLMTYFEFVSQVQHVDRRVSLVHGCGELGVHPDGLGDEVGIGVNHVQVVGD